MKPKKQLQFMKLPSHVNSNKAVRISKDVNCLPSPSNDIKERLISQKKYNMSDKNTLAVKD